MTLTLTGESLWRSSRELCPSKVNVPIRYISIVDKNILSRKEWEWDSKNDRESGCWQWWVKYLDHCDPEPDSEKLKCLHHFYMDNYDSNDKNCYYYWL